VSKRFPVPDFDRDLFKNLSWVEPSPLSTTAISSVAAAAQDGDDSGVGGHPVAVGAELAAHFGFHMEGKPAIMCVLPAGEVRLNGRSWAWQIQRAVVVDSLDPKKATVIADWRTPRPMNTRLGPDAGIVLGSRVLYVLCGHQYGDHWIANRTLIDNKPSDAQQGFAVLSASDDDINDFHACNLTFSWE
jgi:hypothetical protein